MQILSRVMLQHRTKLYTETSNRSSECFNWHYCHSLVPLNEKRKIEEEKKQTEGSISAGAVPEFCQTLNKHWELNSNCSRLSAKCTSKWERGNIRTLSRNVHMAQKHTVIIEFHISDSTVTGSVIGLLRGRASHWQI